MISEVCLSDVERSGRGAVIDRARVIDGADMVKIRNLRTDDLGMLSALFKEHLFYMEQDRSVDRSSPQKLTRQLYFNYVLNVPLSLLGLDTFVGLVAQTDDGNVVGAIIARRFPLGKSWVIGPVVLHANFRHLGIAPCMMNLVMKYLREKKAKSAVLSVERSNIVGRKFFKKFGFEYLEPIFDDHDGARNYARTIALIHGYLHLPSYKIEQCPSRRRNVKLPGMKKMWYIMLKEF